MINNNNLDHSAPDQEKISREKKGTKYLVSLEPEYASPKIPSKTEYECDVLVIGGGFAGLMAAVTASEKGNSVVLIDKGCPGYSGQSPYAGCTRWFDAEMGDDREAVKEVYIRGSQYMGNQNWIEAWLDDSKSVYEKMQELGLFERYENATSTGHIDELNFVGYRQYVGTKDRHKKFSQILKKKGVTIVTQTMVCDVIKQNGRAVGAIGFHVPTGNIIVCHAKATIMCMGGGVYKPAGWPTGGISYDAVAIGYKLGLPIIGQEFEDYHVSRPDEPSNAFVAFSWAYLQNMVFLGGEINAGNIEKSITAGGSMIMPLNEKLNLAMNGCKPWNKNALPTPPPGSMEQNPANAQYTRNINDPRIIREYEKPQPRGNVHGCAAGFGMHTTNGIYCGDQDTHGFTGIPGLYCAGDGCNAGPVGGSSYAGKPGFTSNFVSVQGKRAGEAAAEYVKTVALEKIDKNRILDITNEIQKPLNINEGFSANWALDCLQGIMAPLWTIVLKNKKCLEAALVQVEFMRDHIVPKLMATDSHELRYCLELEHKVLEAEMKLRASLAREESRGGHYRMDFPYHDDKNFLYYISLINGNEGEMKLIKIDYPDEWKGNLSEPYEKRYAGAFWMGEKEAMEEEKIPR